MRKKKSNIFFHEIDRTSKDQQKKFQRKISSKQREEVSFLYSYHWMTNRGLEMMMNFEFKMKGQAFLSLREIRITVPYFLLGSKGLVPHSSLNKKFKRKI